MNKINGAQITKEKNTVLWSMNTVKLLHIIYVSQQVCFSYQLIQLNKIHIFIS